MNLDKYIKKDFELFGKAEQLGIKVVTHANGDPFYIASITKFNKTVISEIGETRDEAIRNLIKTLESRKHV